MKKLLIVLALLGLPFQGWAADSRGTSSAVLFQVSTIDALLSGVYDGDVTIRELKKHGDFGLGTFNKIDGEMLAVDGRYYQIRADGVAYRAPPSTKTPFASIVRFKGMKTLALPKGISGADLEKWLDGRLENRNFFYAIRIDGKFNQMKTRAVAAQEKPYRPLAEVVKTQSVFNLDNTRGVIVGLWSPAFSKGISVPGYHWHFLTADKKAGGHILSFSVDEATAKIDAVSNFSVRLPQNEAFAKTDLARDRARELDKVEKH
jgi:acetolactate decarboxylase